ncbi:MAG TPA: rhomboid family intramembrane serine protease [Thermoanaerobaculia bacterium]|nr:rhomboid family intramembrane serine protease [Thermoanaerobaculia bacterium]
MQRIATLVLATAILVTWLVIAGARPVVTIYELAHRGAAVQATEVWTLVTSQFVHVHRAHMLLNVAHLLLLGWWLEPRLRTARFASVFLLGGAAAQLGVVLAGHIATGASQSVAAIAGAAAPLARTRFQIASAAFVIVTIIGLDLWFAHTIKLGHAIGFVLGALSNLLGRRASR